MNVNIRVAIALAFWAVICGRAQSETLTIPTDPGPLGEAITFIANGDVVLAPNDSVAEFIVEFSPKALANPLGALKGFSSYRSVDWGSAQDASALTITEYVSDGADQIIPLAQAEPVAITSNGYTAGDIPFPSEFPFAIRQFGVRIEGLQGGPTVTFQKDARTAGRGGGQVVPEPTACFGVLLGLGFVVTRYRARN